MTIASTGAPAGDAPSGQAAGKAWRAPDLAPTRWTLIERFKDWGDEASWREFFETYWQLIYAVALKAGLTDTEAQDVVQETVIAVAKKMPEFKCGPQAGSFKGFLLQITGRRITDQFRKRGRAGQASRLPHSGDVPNRLADEDATGRTATIERVPDPAGFALEAVWDEEWRGHLMEMATRRLRQQLDPEQYQMFELHVLQGQPVKEVARKLGVTRAQVYFAKYKVSLRLKKEIRKLDERMT